MREVNLPIGETISFKLNPIAIRDGIEIDNGDGTYAITGPNVGSEQFDEIGQARKNGGKLVYAVIYIEQYLDDIIKGYFLKHSSYYYDRLPLFETDILYGALNFHKKKELVIKIASETDKLIKKKKNKLQKQLTDLMRWRNAFAHGKIMYDSYDGCFIEFHSNGKKQHVLNEDFWHEIETTYSECLSLVKEFNSNI